MNAWYSSKDIEQLRVEMLTRDKLEIARALKELHDGKPTKCGKFYWHKDEEGVEMCPTCSSFSLALYAAVRERPELRRL